MAQSSSRSIRRKRRAFRFIDLFAVACLVFSFTGLFILKMHAGNRPFTWPMVGMGLVIPMLLALLLIH